MLFPKGVYERFLSGYKSVPIRSVGVLFPNRFQIFFSLSLIFPVLVLTLMRGGKSTKKVILIFIYSEFGSVYEIYFIYPQTLQAHILQNFEI